MCILLSRDIGGVFIDVVIREAHSSEMEIAKHPVERGAEIADHAWRKGRVVTIEGIVGEGQAYDAFSRLHALQDKPALFTLVTGFKVYQDMLCRKVEAERDVDYGRALKFTAECEEIILVSTSTTTGQPGRSNSDRAQATQNRGNQNAARVTSGSAGTSSESALKAAQSL